MHKLEHIPELAADASFVFGLGKTMELLNATVMEIAATDIPIWIRGESGTGKDVYAHLLHRVSHYSEASFKKLSCPILDPVELLHHVQHDSPVNSQARPLGTLFLDAVDELDPACQRVLLSILPDGHGPLGIADKSVRVISSSCRDLGESVQTGTFRTELYFRINGFCLRLPPLRERKEDIGAFLEHFLRKHSQDLKRPAPTLDQEALNVLIAHDWPGNIRQLENLVRKMVALGDVQAAVEDIRTARPSPVASNVFQAGNSLKSAAKAASKKAEREMILQALERTRWNRKRAARELQISYKSLLYKVKQIGVTSSKLEG